MLSWVSAKLPISERGQDLIEYAMLGGLIALAILAVGIFFEGAIEDMAVGIGNCIDFDSFTVCDPV
jgi:Flp pilus assembly pilin Flp